jgi:hypothetical protein
VEAADGQVLRSDSDPKSDLPRPNTLRRLIEGAATNREVRHRFELVTVIEALRRDGPISAAELGVLLQEQGLEDFVQQAIEQANPAPAETRDQDS